MEAFAIFARCVFLVVLAAPFAYGVTPRGVFAFALRGPLFAAAITFLFLIARRRTCRQSLGMSRLRIYADETMCRKEVEAVTPAVCRKEVEAARSVHCLRQSFIPSWSTY